MMSTILPKNNKKRSNYIYSCKFCTWVFIQKSKYKRHLKEVHYRLNSYFECPSCPKVFKRRDHLNRHTRCIHLKLHYFCLYCTRSFSQTARLKRHLEDNHEFVRCDKCGTFENTGDHLCDPKDFRPCDIRRGVLYYCDTCHLGCPTQAELEVHNCSETLRKLE